MLVSFCRWGATCVTADSPKWEKTNLHAWSCENGSMSSRWWILTKPKKTYYSTFENRDDYYKGMNIGTFESLREAKKSLISC